MEKLMTSDMYGHARSVYVDCWLAMVCDGGLPIPTASFGAHAATASDMRLSTMLHGED